MPEEEPPPDAMRRILIVAGTTLAIAATLLCTGFLVSVWGLLGWVFWLWLFPGMS